MAFTPGASVLSLWEAMDLEPQVVVVGSGFGGAVVACRLAQAGFRVLVLERGRRFEPGDFPALPKALLPARRHVCVESTAR